MRRRLNLIPPLCAGLLSLLLLSACERQASAPAPVAESAPEPADGPTPSVDVQARLDAYVEVPLEADLSGLSEAQRRMVGKLIEAAQAIDPIFWEQSWGQPQSLLSQVSGEAQREYVQINYGPWDRLNGDDPFIAGIGPRPAGARFYPEDMTREEFEAATLADKSGLYSLLRRDEDGKLMTVPYHQAYAAQLEIAANHLREAAELAEDSGFRHYLELRADALLDDDYQPSDFAWMDMKSNPVDIVIGPIETYEDQLFGYKAAFESYVLIKDVEWSARLARFAKYLPELQRELPVPDRYKAETPGSDADLNAYYAVYYAGDANVGAKTIAINLPNDEQVQLEKGTRRLQLENVMQAKFDKIMLPIAEVLIADEQQDNLSFDAFFQNTMFHEVAHGLGIKNMLDGTATVRKALKEYASAFEEGKADVLGLYMVTKLAQKGELDESQLMDNYVTFLAGIFRSVRFGASDAHAKANMVRFNFFKSEGAFTRDEETGRYRVNFDRMQQAMNDLSAKLLTVQGDGDYAEAERLTAQMGDIGEPLASDLKRLSAADIPVDIRFRQGADVLGLQAE